MQFQSTKSQEEMERRIMKAMKNSKKRMLHPQATVGDYSDTHIHPEFKSFADSLDVTFSQDLLAMKWAQDKKISAAAALSKDYDYERGLRKKMDYLKNEFKKEIHLGHASAVGSEAIAVGGAEDGQA